MATTRNAHPPTAHSAATVAATRALGRRIHDLRSARGFSLQEFALLAGTTAPIMSALERGDEDAPLFALLAAADALELPLSSVVADPPTAPGAPPPAAVGHPHVSPTPEPSPPAGYVPLEMPDLWEPEAGSAAHAEPAPAVLPPPAPRAASGPVPRTFADLRRGRLADRTFSTLPEFAVAAVVEGGHPVSVVAKIFRVPSWRLESWVQNGVAPTAAPTPIRRSR